MNAESKPLGQLSVALEMGEKALAAQSRRERE